MGAVVEVVNRNPRAEIIYIHREGNEEAGATIVPLYVLGVDGPERNPWQYMVEATELREKDEGMVAHTHIEPGMF